MAMGFFSPLAPQSSVRYPCGSRAAPVHPCGTRADPVRNPCGTRAEQRRNRGGTAAEPRRIGGVASSVYSLQSTIAAQAAEKKSITQRPAAKPLRNTTKTTRAPPIAEPGVRPRGKEARRQTQRRGPRVLRAVVGVTRARVAKTTQGAPPPPSPLPPFATAHITIAPLRH